MLVYTSVGKASLTGQQEGSSDTIKVTINEHRKSFYLCDSQS